MAKYICVPESITFRNLITRTSLEGEEYSFFRWIQGECLNDTRFGTNWKAGRSAAQIADAFFGAKAGDWVELETADYELLKEAAQEPMRYDPQTRQAIKGYMPALLQQIGPYIAAVQAGDTNTKPPKEE